jgi:hypothetical protein
MSNGKKTSVDDPLGILSSSAVYSEDTIPSEEEFVSDDPLGIGFSTGKKENVPKKILTPEEEKEQSIRPVTIFSPIREQRKVIQEMRDAHVDAWAQHMEEIKQDPTQPKMTSPYSLQQSYVISAGFDNSLMGLTYNVLAGKPMSSKMLGEELYNWKDYDPSLVEEIGAISFGFMLDAPLFAVGVVLYRLQDEELLL